MSNSQKKDLIGLALAEWLLVVPSAMLKSNNHEIPGGFFFLGSKLDSFSKDMSKEYIICILRTSQNEEGMNNEMRIYYRILCNHQNHVFKKRLIFFNKWC